MAQTRPSRIIQPTAKLGADNAGDVELRSHKVAIAKARGSPSESSTPLSTPLSTLVPSQSTSFMTAATVPDKSTDRCATVPDDDNFPTKSMKRCLADSDAEDNNKRGDNDTNTSLSTESTPRHRKPKKKKRAKKSTTDNLTLLCIACCLQTSGGDVDSGWQG